MSQELFERYLQDQLTEAEQRRLADLLATEKGSHEFAEFLQEWTLLAQVSKTLDAQPADSTRGGTTRIQIRRMAGSDRSRSFGWAIGAAAAVLFVLGVILASGPSPAPKPGHPVAERMPVSPAPAPMPLPVPRPEPPAPPPTTPEARPSPAPEPAGRGPQEKPVPPVVPEKSLSPEPAPKIEPVPAAPVEKSTITVLANVERVQGVVTLMTQEGRRPAVAGQDLLPDQGLETAPRTGFLGVKYPDQTRFDLLPGSAVDRLLDVKGKAVHLSRGTLSATVTKQPAGRPMTIRTPHAEATVLGTQLTIVVTADATRLEVREGRVKLTRMSDGAAIEVAAGHMTIAAKGAKLEARALVVSGSFQDGVSPAPAYAGTRETSISGAEPNRNFGSADPIEADGDEIDGKNIYALLKWDVSEVPAGSVVRSVVIHLNVMDVSLGGGYHLFEMKRPWVEAEATWRAFSAGKEWRAAGARSPQDRGTEMLGMVAPREKGSVAILLNGAGESLVQSWIRNPASNHGILIANDTNVDGFKFTTHESPVAERRPKLTIEYTPGTK